jgi:hypothetical protein
MGVGGGRSGRAAVEGGVIGEVGGEQWEEEPIDLKGPHTQPS